jgi:uncharacterized protein (DUF58 family)
MPVSFADRFRALATYDVFPEFSVHVRRFVLHPLGVLLMAALASLVCGFFLHAQGFVLAGALLAVLAFGVVWPWVSLAGLVGSVGFDRARVSEGESVEVHLALRNLLPWPAIGLAVKAGFGSDATIAVAGISAAPRRRSILCRWIFTPTRRGVFPLTTPRIVTGFPFGLWESSRRAVVESPLIVWPKTFPVGPLPIIGGEHLVEGNVSRRKVGTNGDVLGVRPYRRGDSPRRIHWGQSAKHDRLIVCELQSNSRPVVQLVLDAEDKVHEGQSREWTIRIVASLAKGWLENGAQVGLAFGNTEIAPASGSQQLTRILDSLAALNDEEPPKPLATLLQCPACRGFREGLQVIVTTNRVEIEPGQVTAERDHQRWCILETSAFVEKPSTAEEDNPKTPVEAWLHIDSAEAIPTLLRSGWSEARHGS